jgi:hypothetical protein
MQCCAAETKTGARCVNLFFSQQLARLSHAVDPCDLRVEIKEELFRMTTKRTIFLDVTLYSPVEVHGCFGGIYCRHVHGGSLNQITSKYSHPSHGCLHT